MKNSNNKSKLTAKKFRKKNDDEVDPILIILAIIFGIALYVIAKDPFGISVFGKLLKPISSMLLKISNILNL